MDQNLLSRVAKFLREHHSHRNWQKVVTFLAAVVVFCTTYALILPAITMTPELICGEEEHTHTEECYAQVLSCDADTLELHQHTKKCYDGDGNLICGYADYVIHTHDENCYDAEGKLVCQLPEIKEHVHNESCYQEQKVLVCGQEETEEHTHTDECYKTERVLVCGQQGLHTHTDACYDKDGNLICGLLELTAHQHTAKCFDTVLICDKVEHVHTDACYAAEPETNSSTPEPETSSVEPETSSEAEPENSSDLDPETDGDADSEIGSEAEPENSSDVEPETGSDAEPEIAPFSLLPPNEEGIAPQSEDDDNEDQDGAPSGTEFGSYITTVTIAKLQNGKWVNSTEFQDGDQVKVSIEYELPENLVTEAKRTIYYQLPDGVRPLKEESGPVYRNSVPVGTYQISTEGLIQIIFDDSFANGDAFEGTIEFQGTVAAGESGNRTEIKLGGDGGSTTIIINPVEEAEKTDISISKTGAVSQTGTNQVDYTVTVSTVEGTGKEVKFEDWLGSNGTYIENSVKVYKITASGTKEAITATPAFQYNNSESSDSPYLLINSLPELAAGESYEITYSATATPSADGSCKLANAASANGRTTWNEVTISNSKISKSGWYDSKTDKIYWTINVNGCAGYTLTDTIAASDGTEITLPTTVTLKDNSSGTETSITLPYRFGADQNGSYTITYQTDAPAGDTTVSNTVSVGGGSGGYSSPSNVEVVHRKWGVSKGTTNTNSGTLNSNNQLMFFWNVEVSIPDGPLTEFTYTDTIQDPTDTNGNPITGAHYAIAKQLQASIEQNLKLECTDGTTYSYTNDKVTFAVTYYDASGNEVAASDDSTHVKSFQIKVTPTENCDITNPYRLRISEYATLADYDEMNAGDTWTLTNTGTVNNLSTNSSYTYTKPYPLVKKVGAVNQYGNVTSYTEGSVSVDYDTTKGILNYRLVLNPDVGSNDEIVLVDVLPKGMTYVDNSVRGLFYTADNIWWQTNGYTNSEGQYVNYDFTGNQKPTVVVEPQADGTTKLTITIQGGYNSDGENHSLAIDYQVTVANDEDWDDLSNETKAYINTVTWGDNTAQHTVTAEQTTTVEREVDKVQKTGVQVENEDNVVEYKVIINPAASDLDPNSNTLTLVDTLNLTDDVGAYLDLANTKLYQYDAKNDTIGAAVDTTRYQMTYDELNHVFTVKLPDSLACVLVYRYNIDRGAVAQPWLSNRVSLAGQWSDETGWMMQATSSSATVTKGKLTIYKVDASDYTKLLSGAEFTLEYWNNSWPQGWQVVNTDGLHPDGVYTTENGELMFEDAEGKSLNTNILYRLTETKAPAGYKSGTPYYFVFMEKENDKSQTLTIMNNIFGEWNSGVSSDSVNFYPSDREATMYIPNEYTALDVKKVWVDENGGALSDPPGNVQVQLYQGTRKAHTCTVTFIADDPWNSDITMVKEVPVNTSVTISVSGSYADLVTVTKNGETFGKVTGANNTLTITTNSIEESCTIRIDATDGVWFDEERDFTFTIAQPTEFDENWNKYDDLVTLNDTNGWSYTWTDLAQTDDAGNSYYYTVEEVDAPDGYTVSYINNDGIQSGEIVVTNQKQSTETPEYTLPQTGGPGATLYTMGGLLVSAGAAFLLYKNFRRRKEDM